MPNSGKVDRFWFRSLYFREPNGILFEFATDGPGFAVDEPLKTFGESLVLPPFLEGGGRRWRRVSSHCSGYIFVRVWKAVLTPAPPPTR